MASKPPPPRLPLPRRASNSAPLPPPAAKCPRQRREKQEVKAGAKGQTEPGGPGRRHSRSAWRPRADSRSRPTAPRPGALPRGPWNRPGEGSPGYRDGCDPFLPPWPVTARPRPRPQAGTLRPGRAPFCGAGAPRFHCCGSLPPLPERTRTRALTLTAPREPGIPLPPAPRALRFPGIPEAGYPRRLGQDRVGRPGTVGPPLSRGASGPALTSASPPGRWQHCAGSPQLPDRGTRLTSARRQRSVGYPRKWEGPEGERRASALRRDLNSSTALLRAAYCTPVPCSRL